MWFFRRGATTRNRYHADDGNPAARTCVWPHIVVADVEEWQASAIHVVVRQQPGQASCKPTPIEVGMGADRADFLQRIHAQALAGHRREAAVLVNAEIASELHRPRAEIMRIDQRRERQRVGAMGIVQFDDIRAVDNIDRAGTHHLRQVRERVELPTFRHARCDTEQQDRVVGGHQRFQRRPDVDIRIGHAQERGDIGRDNARGRRAARDVTMPRAQRRPEGIVEFEVIHAEMLPTGRNP